MPRCLWHCWGGLGLSSTSGSSGHHYPNLRDRLPSLLSTTEEYPQVPTWTHQLSNTATSLGPWIDITEKTQESNGSCLQDMPKPGGPELTPQDQPMSLCGSDVCSLICLHLHVVGCHCAMSECLVHPIIPTCYLSILGLSVVLSLAPTSHVPSLPVQCPSVCSAAAPSRAR